VTPVDDRLLALAEDVGRLRRRIRAESRESSYLAFLAGRVADHVETLAGMLEPTAAELVAAGLLVEGALEAVDRRVSKLRGLLGGPS
jgi:hypothetical protein